MRKLGKTQLGVLQTLSDHGPWSDYKSCMGGSWEWSTCSPSRRVIERLAVLGLACTVRQGPPLTIYVITAAGRELLTK